MKKTLILSLGLIIALGLSGCSNTTELKKPIKLNTKNIINVIEKPVMILGEGLEGGDNIISIDSTEENTEPVTETENSKKL